MKTVKIDHRINYADDLSEVLGFVANETGICQELIIKRGKSISPIYEARHIYNYIARIYTRKSYRQIGSQINRDHASSLNSVKTVKNWMDTDDAFKQKVVSIEKKITKMLK